MKRQRARKIKDTPPPPIVEHWLEAKLVCEYGFCCGKDMLKFASILGKRFMEWASQYMFQHGVVITSIATLSAKDCCHYGWIGVGTLRSEVLQKRPRKWFHVQHVNLERKIPLPEYKQVAFSFVCNNTISFQGNLIFNGQFTTNVERLYDDKASIAIDNSHHTDENCHFIVLMKFSV